MSGKVTLLLGGLAAVALVLVAVVLIYPRSDVQNDQIAAADRRVASFVNDCALKLIDRGYLEMENTEAQVRSVCTCLGEDFRANLEGKTAEEISTFLNGGAGQLVTRKSATRCFNNAGMDFNDKNFGEE